ncbi:hypothetical protein ACFV98_00445 [Streptomyces violascens]|uniref:hypothetical protein n=1 Tax=Streptomyces violascens TaxID=67381 RepID=UPI00365AF191
MGVEQAEALTVVTAGAPLGAGVAALNLLGIGAALVALSLSPTIVVPWGRAAWRPWWGHVQCWRWCLP